MRFSSGLFFTVSALVLASCSTTQSNPIYQQSTKYKSSNPTVATVVRQASVQTQAAVPVIYVAEQPVSAQAAHYTQVNQECLSKEANRKVIGTVAGGAIGALAGRKLGGDNKTLGTIAGAAIGGAAGYGIADKTIACSPTQIPVGNTAQTATITPAYQAPIYQAEDQNIYATSTTQPTYIAPSQTSGIEENVESLGDEGTPGFYAMQGTESFEAPAETVNLAEVSAEQPVYQDFAKLQSQIVTPEIAITSPASLTARTHRIIPGDTVYSLARNSCVSVAELKRLNNINDAFYIRVGEDITIPSKSCTP